MGEWVYWTVLTLCVLLAGAGVLYGVVLVIGEQEMVIEVYQDGRGEWRWRAIARNNRIVADSGEGYSSRRNAMRAARKLKASMATAMVVE